MVDRALVIRQWRDCSIHPERPIAQRINAGFYFSIVSRLLRKNS
jgi:hypothetical protein